MSLAIIVQSRDKQYANRWMWLYFNRTLLKNTSGGPDRIWLVDPDLDYSVRVTVT